ncbi:hypothetical protein MNBD_GAMMA26-428 [hydrothermal vent metagenome]|uniref:CN hydrolase domain-containing protein n=1 Tax=hydrothermal vent metagenome TaxID=652676 RepID=A0A3B1BPT2_9ZZZZ
MYRVGFFQFAPEFGQVESNLSKVVSALTGVEADLIVLPELPFTGYCFQDRAELVTLAENPADSATVASLVELCRANNFHLVTGFAEQSVGKIFNSALLINGEGIVKIYRKLHLFNTEVEYFDPGDKPLEVVEVNGVKIGLMICYDWAFPEVARTLALQGAELLCHPSNLVLAWGQQAMQTRCLENGLFAVTANRLGSDVRLRGTVSFTGQSQVAGPEGVLLHRATVEQEELFIVEIDLEQARDKKVTPMSDLIGDRRPEFYGALVKSVS